MQYPGITLNNSLNFELRVRSTYFPFPMSPVEGRQEARKEMEGKTKRLGNNETPATVLLWWELKSQS